MTPSESPSPLSEVLAFLQTAVAHHQQGHLALAEELYKKVLASSPEQPDAWHLLGVLAFQSGKHDDAVALIDKAISIYPREASYYSNRGLALKQLNRLEEALASYDCAVALKPDYVDAYYYRGVVLQRLGRSEDALASYEIVVRLRPDHAKGYSNRGTALQGLCHLEEALASYERAIALKPDYAEAYCNRGVVLQKLKRFEDALASHDQAITLKPDYADAYCNRGHTLQTLQRFEDALTSYEQAIRIQPDHADAWYNRGLVYQSLEQFEGALASYEQAITLDVNYTDVYYNSGLAFHEMKQFDQALASYKRAIALKPDYAEAHWNHALCLLLLERYTEGWKQYEWRWKYKGFTSPLRPFQQPLWLGEQDIAGKTVLLHAEQGLGDTIQFARYAKLVRALGARVILEVPKALIPLMRSLEGADELVEKDQPLPHFDLHCPLLSLPLAFKTDAASIPAQVPYLSVSEERIERWWRHIGTAGFKIAICWQGSPNGKIDIGRSFPVALFENISKIPGVRLISLQKGAGTEQLQNLPAGMRVETLPPGFDEGEGAFLDSAAVMGCVDMVITSDTALTHLAGALGVKSWLPLKYVPDWRWLLERSDSPWYPNHRLFRQSQRDDWQSVFAEMELELGKLMSGHSI
jgi:tetratricopeptide (TPR) repeat protein